MRKKMTLTLDAAVYDGLCKLVGRGNISKFLEDLARPHVVKDDLLEAYRAMAADTEREREAAEWCNGLIGDVADLGQRIIATLGNRAEAGWLAKEIGVIA